MHHSLEEDKSKQNTEKQIGVVIITILIKVAGQQNVFWL